MAVSAHDVVREIRARLGDIGDVRMQKLLYYCQGIHLAWHDEPFFPERIEAWDMGPVVADVFRMAKHGNGFEPLPEAELDAAREAVLEEVLDRYGRLNAGELKKLTHAESPWEDVYPGPDVRPSPIIPIEALAEEFREQEGVDAIEAETARLISEHAHLRLQAEPLTDEVKRMIAESSPNVQIVER